MRRPSILITRTPMSVTATHGYTYRFTTGNVFKEILKSIKALPQPVLIDLYECENMPHFKNVLMDNFPDAIIRHVNTV